MQPVTERFRRNCWENMDCYSVAIVYDEAKIMLFPKERIYIAMTKEFNVTGVCIPELHYMVDITQRLEEIRDRKSVV